MTVTPHDIAQLAEIRRRDPELAMKIAAASAAQSAPKPITLNDVAGMVCADVARTGVAA